MTAVSEHAKYGRWAMAAVAFLLAGCADDTKLAGENLLVPLLPGFKVGYQAANSKMRITEFVPVNETVENWSQMETVQIFSDMPDVAPEEFLGRISRRWVSSCLRARAYPVHTRRDNNYAIADMYLECPSGTFSGKPEHTLFRALRGSDALYLVQRAFTYNAPASDMETAMAFLQQAGLCDPRYPEHPCPPLQAVAQH